MSLLSEMMAAADKVVEVFADDARVRLVRPSRLSGNAATEVITQLEAEAAGAGTFYLRLSRPDGRLRGTAPAGLAVDIEGHTPYRIIRDAEVDRQSRVLTLQLDRSLEASLIARQLVILADAASQEYAYSKASIELGEAGGDRHLQVDDVKLLLSSLGTVGSPRPGDLASDIATGESLGTVLAPVQGQGPWVVFVRPPSGGDWAEGAA